MTHSKQIVSKVKQQPAKKRFLKINEIHTQTMTDWMKSKKNIEKDMIQKEIKHTHTCLKYYDYKKNNIQRRVFHWKYHNKPSTVKLKK